jgi:hypothetical protein
VEKVGAYLGRESVYARRLIELLDDGAWQAEHVTRESSSYMCDFHFKIQPPTAVATVATGKQSRASRPCSFRGQFVKPLNRGASRTCWPWRRRT